MAETRTPYAAAPLRAMAWHTVWNPFNCACIDPDDPAGVVILPWQAWVQVDTTRGALFPVFEGAGTTKAEAIADALSVAKECLGTEVVVDGDTA